MPSWKGLIHFEGGGGNAGYGGGGGKSFNIIHFLPFLVIIISLSAVLIVEIGWRNNNQPPAPSEGN